MKTNLLWPLAIAAAFCGQANAQTMNAWVDRYGDDANPCSSSAPCRTFAAAMSKVASGGQIKVRRGGTYGRFNINKSVTIDGAGDLPSGPPDENGNPTGGIQPTVIDTSGSEGVRVDGVGAAVTLKNLTLSGGGKGPTGINFLQAASLTVQKVSLTGNTLAAINVQSSTNAVITLDEVIASGPGASFVVNPKAGIEIHGSLDISG